MQRLDASLAALANPARRAIIARLASDGPAPVTALAEPFDMSLNAVSKHLKVLEQAGLVQRTRRGREHFITFDPAPLKELSRWIGTYERFWADHLDRLATHFTVKAEGEKS